MAEIRVEEKRGSLAWLWILLLVLLLVAAWWWFTTQRTEADASVAPAAVDSAVHEAPAPPAALRSAAA